MNKRLTLIPLAALLLASCTDTHLQDAMDSIRPVAPNAFYMEFKGEDGVNALLAQGGISNNEELAEFDVKFISAGLGIAPEMLVPSTGGACSELCAATPKGERIIGRNFDWYACDAMTVKVEPKHGYKSLSTVNINFLGLPYGTELTTPEERIIALSAIMTPMDGINEKGLAIAINDAGDHESPGQNTDKPDLTFSTAVRVILDKAANVEEALEILRAHDIHAESAKPDEALAFHFIIADASGRSVCVEWVKSKMYVTETNILTNHYLCAEKRGVTQYANGEGNTFERFDKLAAMDSVSNGHMEEAVLTGAMATISPSPTDYFGGTQWTAVYNMATLSGTWYYHRNFEDPFMLRL